MTIEGMNRKLVAILSMDVKGYSRLMGDDEAWTVRTITAYRDVISSMIRNTGGRVVDSPGDNLLAEFSSVVDAVQTAVEIQQVLKLRNAQLPEDRKMEFRIGINLGDVIEEDGRLYGDGVNIAARIEALADPGGICISGSVYELIRNKLTLMNEFFGEHAVKNISEPVSVYKIQIDSAGVDEQASKQTSKFNFWKVGLFALIGILVLGLGALLISGGFPTTAAPETATTMPTVEPTVAPTEKSTNTPEPTPTSTVEATATPTPIPTLEPATITFTSNANCRSGQGTSFPVAFKFALGDEVEVLAVDTSGEYFYIQNPLNANVQCWVYYESVAETGDFDALPIYTPVPTP